MDWGGRSRNGGSFTIAVHQLCIFIFSDDCFECKQQERLKNCRAISENLKAFSPHDGWLQALTKKDPPGGAASAEMINLIVLKEHPDKSSLSGKLS